MPLLFFASLFFGLVALARVWRAGWPRFMLIGLLLLAGLLVWDCSALLAYRVSTVKDPSFILTLGAGVFALALGLNGVLSFQRKRWVVGLLFFVPAGLAALVCLGGLQSNVSAVGTVSGGKRISLHQQLCEKYATRAADGGYGWRVLENPGVVEGFYLDNPRSGATLLFTDKVRYDEALRDRSLPDPVGHGLISEISEVAGPRFPGGGK